SKTTSVNGLFTTTQTDNWGRPTSVTPPDGQAETSTKAWDMTNGALYYTLSSKFGSPDVKTWYDILGRHIKTSTEQFNGAWLTGTTTYGAKGNVLSETTPHLPP